jgi:hypothetical protein
MPPGGSVVFTGQQIRDGQNVWQSLGGQEVGTVWGHGGYVAPDWSADWLHREAVWLLDHWARADNGRGYDELGAEAKAALRARLQQEPGVPELGSYRKQSPGLPGPAGGRPDVTSSPASPRCRTPASRPRSPPRPSP